MPTQREVSDLMNLEPLPRKRPKITQGGILRPSQSEGKAAARTIYNGTRLSNKTLNRPVRITRSMTERPKRATSISSTLPKLIEAHITEMSNPATLQMKIM